MAGSLGAQQGTALRPKMKVGGLKKAAKTKKPGRGAARPRPRARSSVRGTLAGSARQRR